MTELFHLLLSFLSTSCQHILLNKMVYQNPYPEIMTARKVDKLTFVRRAEEERIKNLVQYQNESRRLVNAIRNFETPITPKEVNNTLNDDDEKQRIEQAALRIAQREKKEDEGIINERKRLEALQKERIEREIQRICESSEELKELERNIKIGYMNKERAAQHQEALLMKEVDHARDILIEQCMEEQRRKLIEKENDKDGNRRERLIAQKVQLQEQMQENEVR